MYIQKFKQKGDVFKAFRQLNSFKASVEQIEPIIKAMELESGIFNTVGVLDKSETSDLFFKREEVSICEISTKYDVFPVLTFSMVGYDLLDSKQLVIFNITHRNALEFHIRKDKVVFRPSDIYKTLNAEETRVLRRQRALRHGNFSKEAETTSEVEYAAENGYLSEFVEENGSEVFNWYKNTSADFNDSEESLYGFDSEIEDILELLRAEDNSMSSVTPIEAYLPSDSRWDRGKTSKSKYTTRDGVILSEKGNMLSKNQIRRNELIRENFRRYKHSMESMNKFLSRRNELGEYEHFLRLLKAGKQDLDQFAADMALYHQIEAAEVAAEEMADWLLCIADIMTRAEVKLTFMADLALNGQIEGYMEFVTAKTIAEELNNSEEE